MNPLNPRRFSHHGRIAADSDVRVGDMGECSGLNYEVWVTTDLAQPFTKISGPTAVPSAGATTSYTDGDAGFAAKFYQVRTVQ